MSRRALDECYASKVDKHIRPVLGAIPAVRVDAETLESFYADLRTCRDHCWREHASMGEAHVGKPLSDSSVRAIHGILSGAFRRAVRWGWLAVNPTEHAEPPPCRSPIRIRQHQRKQPESLRSPRRIPSGAHLCGQP
jgi:hypothetical protein